LKNDACLTPAASDRDLTADIADGADGKQSDSQEICAHPLYLRVSALPIRAFGVIRGSWILPSGIWLRPISLAEKPRKKTELDKFGKIPIIRSRRSKWTGGSNRLTFWTAQSIGGGKLGKTGKP